MQKKEYSVEIGGKQMIAEFNDWANQANGSVLLRYGNSAVLATVVMSSRESNLDYFPLSVEYEEKFYAAGAILGSRFMRREGRPSDEAVLSGRIVDRTIRPLFPKGLKRDVQVIITVLSTDQENEPDVLGTVAASAALTISEIPFLGPVGAVRVGRIVDAQARRPPHRVLGLFHVAGIPAEVHDAGHVGFGELDTFANDEIVGQSALREGADERGAVG